MNNNYDFTNFEQFLQKIFQKFDELTKKYSNQFNCKKGCHSCCAGGLTITQIEAAYIRRWIELHPQEWQKIAQTYSAAGAISAKHSSCEFLDRDGACSIYEARPVVCRSHGAPILMPSESSSETLDADVCPLNFKDVSLDVLPASDWVRVDTLNLILTALNKEFDEAKVSERVLLSPKTFVQV